MDADTILRIKPALTEYLHQFNSCMGRVTNRHHLQTYVAGQLSALQRKSIEPIADAAGQSPRTLQEFLGLLRWVEAAMRDVLQRRAAERYAHPHSVGLIDETSFHKQGSKTACVQRQHCGSRGKRDNCVVSVHLGYAAGDFHTLLDGTLYLPEETWHEDRDRCRAAGISARKRTLRKLHGIGIILRNLRTCHWPRKWRCSISHVFSLSDSHVLSRLDRAHTCTRRLEGTQAPP